MTTDIPSAATPIDRDFPGNNLRSRDCGGLQDEERHRSLCGRTNGGDRKNYRLAAATSESAWGRADLPPGRIRAGCAIQDGRPALTHPPGGIKKCGGAATQPGLDRAERNGTTGRGLGGRRLCAGLASGTPPGRAVISQFTLRPMVLRAVPLSAVMLGAAPVPPTLRGAVLLGASLCGAQSQWRELRHGRASSAPRSAVHIDARRWNEPRHPVSDHHVPSALMDRMMVFRAEENAILQIRRPRIVSPPAEVVRLGKTRWLMAVRDSAAVVALCKGESLGATE